MEILQINAHDYAQIVSFLQSASNTVAQQENFWDDAMFCAFLENWLMRIEEICDKDELPVTKVLVIHVRGLFRIAAEEDHPLAPLAPGLLDKTLPFEYLERIRLTLIDELSTKFFFQLPNQKKQWFEAPKKGWESITERFPDTLIDVEEMNKCFALSRYTGAVFHSLLIVEAGLIRLGGLLGVTDPKVGWDATCKRMQQLVTSGHNAFPKDSPIEFSALEQINQSAQAMKQAWRNKVNHAAGSLTVMRSDFAPDVAEEIILGTRGFMRRLANALPK